MSGGTVSDATRQAVDVQAFELKLGGTKSAKRLLVSAGPVAAKDRLFPLIKRLHEKRVEIFATAGTAAHFASRGLAVTKVNKIAEGILPNVQTLLEEGGIDCVINILTGVQDYDESSDSRIIRSLSIKSEIPLFTDPDLAEAQLSHVLSKIENPRPSPHGWDIKSQFLDLVAAHGGFKNHHGHFDKAYLINGENLALSQKDMQKKWYLYRYLKENYTRDDLFQRMSRCVDVLVRQGCTYTRTMVDADSIVKTLPLETALEVKAAYKGRIHIDIGVQALEGVINPETRKFFQLACEKADFIGGLPSRDRPQPEKHLDIVMGFAKSMNKPLDVHVDQENNPDENETELLALKAIEHGLEGRVFGVHAISVAAKPPHEQDRIYKIVKDAGMGIICCPSAALSMKMLERTAPLHNSIANVPRLLELDIPVYLGVDNIADLFMPVVDADMYVECRMLMEACRYYDIEKVAALATKELPWSKK